MVVRIRLARHGTRNNPFYHVVAIRDKAAREARPIEKLGEYDPIPRPPVGVDGPLQGWQSHPTNDFTASSSNPKLLKRQLDRPILTSGIHDPAKQTLEKRIEWNVERIQYWLSVGAQPSKPVVRLLDRAGLIPEGKWYKGMYKSEQEHKDRAAASSKSQSKILSAVGGAQAAAATATPSSASTASTTQRGSSVQAQSEA